MKSSYLRIFAVIILIGVYLASAQAYYFYNLGRAKLVLPQAKTAVLSADNNMDRLEITYAALGDSLTAGAGAQIYEETYPYLLAAKLVEDGRNIDLKNHSFCGAKSADLLNTLLDPAIAEKPDMITLLIGVNDVHGRTSAEEFKANYQSILDRLKKETGAKIYVISLPLIGARSLVLPLFNYFYKAKTLKFNSIIKTLAAQYQAEYVDLTGPTTDLFRKKGSHYSVDSFHPSALGYKLWADIIYADIHK